MVTHSVHSTLNSIGGIQVLFPLFAQLDLPSSESQTSSNEITPTASTNDKSSTATAVSTKDQSLWYVYSYITQWGNSQKKTLEIRWMNFTEFFFVYFQYFLKVAIHKWHEFFLDSQDFLKYFGPFEFKFFCVCSIEYLRNFSLFLFSISPDSIFRII